MKYFLLMALLVNLFALQNEFAHHLGQGYDQTAAMKFFHYTKVVTCALEVLLPYDTRISKLGIAATIAIFTPA